MGPVTRETNSSTEQLQNRTRLRELFAQTPIPVDDLMANLGLYIRGSALVKLLVLDDLFRRIVEIPGAIVEFGCFYGQNLVVFENLRAIYEPFNKTRQIIGFDTFQGYAGFSEKDVRGEVLTEGNYGTLSEWKTQLEELLSVHEGNNVLGHLRGNHTIVAGDVVETAPEFFAQHPELTVALAYFDVGLYEPTKAGLTAIKPHLIPGSVILLDEFSWPAAKGEAIAFKEVFGDARFRLEKSALTPLRAIVTILEPAR
jgi:hypothetical protein